MNTYKISDAIGYDVEVSEPNGPAVHGYITDRWANSRQPEFDRWLAEHDREVAEKAWDEGAIFGIRNQHGTVDVYIRDAIERRNPYREED